jgi:hypothetical protein
VVRQTFQLARCGSTLVQSNTTNIIFTWVHTVTPTHTKQYHELWNCWLNVIVTTAYNAEFFTLANTLYSHILLCQAILLGIVPALNTLTIVPALKYNWH